MKKKYHSDMERLRSLKDEEIDTSDIPELDASFFEKAVVSLPKNKVSKQSLDLKSAVLKPELGNE